MSDALEIKKLTKENPTALNPDVHVLVAWPSNGGLIPIYIPAATLTQIGLMTPALVAQLNNCATLVEGKVPATQLPAFVDDVIEVASYSSLPGISSAETGKIYVTLDTNLTYRWTGSTYTEISKSLALGEGSGSAYRGDRGKIAYDHSQLTGQNPHGLTPEILGLGNVDNTSDAQKVASGPIADALNVDQILGLIIYKGVFYADDFTIPDPASSKYHYYICADESSSLVFNSGASNQYTLNFVTADWLVSDGAKWHKTQNHDGAVHHYKRMQSARSELNGLFDSGSNE